MAAMTRECECVCPCVYVCVCVYTIICPYICYVYANTNRTSRRQEFGTNVCFIGFMTAKIDINARRQAKDTNRQLAMCVDIHKSVHKVYTCTYT